MNVQWLKNGNSWLVKKGFVESDDRGAPVTIHLLSYIFSRMMLINLAHYVFPEKFYVPCSRWAKAIIHVGSVATRTRTCIRS